MITMSSVTDPPWNRSGWAGELVSIDGCDTTDFTQDDVASILAYGDTGDGWIGKTAGIAVLKDGRFIAWESDWGPTGSGFSEGAYGGTADIGFAQTQKAALAFIAEDARELLVWNDVTE